MDPTVPPQDVRLFEEPGPVGYYMMYAGAASDTVRNQLVADGIVVDRCEPRTLDGEAGYFCQFDFVPAGEYEIATYINDMLVESLAFRVVDRGDAHNNTASFNAPPRQQSAAVPWRRRPNARDFARVYPDDALDRGVSGCVLLNCTVLNQGRVDCRVVVEDPQNMSFGDAALRLSRSFRMRTTLEDGSSTSGLRVDVPIRFRPGQQRTEMSDGEECPMTGR